MTTFAEAIQSTEFDLASEQALATAKNAGWSGPSEFCVSIWTFRIYPDSQIEVQAGAHWEVLNDVLARFAGRVI